MATAEEKLLDYATWLIKSQSEEMKVKQAMLDAFNLKEGFEHKLADTTQYPENGWLIPVVDPAPNDSVTTLSSTLANREPRWEVRIPQDAMRQTLADRTSAFAIENWRKIYKVRPNLRRLGDPPTPIEKQQESYENIIKTIFAQNDRLLPMPLRSDSTQNGFVFNEIVHKVVDARLSSGYKSYANKMKYKSPFIIRNVDPLGFYSERNEYGLLYAIERTVRTLRDVKALYGNRLGKVVDGLENGAGFVLLAEIYWCEDGEHKYACLIENADTDYSNLSMDEKMEKTAWVDGGIKENTLGFIPYTQEYCSAMPFLYAAVKSGLIVASNISWTYQTSMPLRDANTNYKFKGFNEGDKMPVIDRRMTKQLQLRENQDIQPLDTPSDPRLSESVRGINNRLQEALVPGSVYGSYGANTPASGFNLATTQGTMKINPIKRALGEILAADAQMIFDYIRGREEYAPDDCKLELWMQSGKVILEPADLPEHMEIKCNVEEERLQDEIARLNAAEQAAVMVLPSGKSFFSHQEALRFARVEDINRVLKELEDQQGGSAKPATIDRTRLGEQTVNLPSQAVPPQTMAGMPVAPNPQVPQPAKKGLSNLLRRGR